MMALRAHARGGPEQLVYEQAPAPSAGPGEVLIAVHAAAITFAELTWDLEWTTRDGEDRTPVIPSHEMSGVVAGHGAGVARRPGDEVIGLVDFDRDGAAAEYVVVPAASLAAKPQSVSHVAAATLPLAALTAWQALADHAALQPGEQVLVQGAPAESGYSSSSSRRSWAATSPPPAAAPTPIRAGPRRGTLHQRRGRASRPGRGRVRCRRRHGRRCRAGGLVRPAARGRPAGQP